MAGIGYPGIKWNIAGTTAPGVGDDIDDDYQVGSFWVDTVGLAIYQCISNARGAAVWSETSGATPDATSRGQMLYSTDGATFTAQTPVVSDDFGIILTEDDTGYIIVAA